MIPNIHVNKEDLVKSGATEKEINNVISVLRAHREFAYATERILTNVYETYEERKEELERWAQEVVATEHDEREEFLRNSNLGKEEFSPLTISGYTDGRFHFKGNNDFKHASIREDTASYHELLMDFVVFNINMIDHVITEDVRKEFIGKVKKSPIATKACNTIMKHILECENNGNKIPSVRKDITVIESLLPFVTDKKLRQDAKKLVKPQTKEDRETN